MRCLMNDLKPSYKLKMKYSDDEFFLTMDNDIYNLRTGQKITTLQKGFYNILEVTDCTGKMIALNVANTLVLYDPIQHDKELLLIKNSNNLFTYDELIVEFKNKDFGICNINSLSTVKVLTSKLKNIEKRVKTYKGYMEVLNNLQITIFKYEIRRDIFLYAYDISTNIFI